MLSMIDIPTLHYEQKRIPEIHVDSHPCARSLEQEKILTHCKSERAMPE